MAVLLNGFSTTISCSLQPGLLIKETQVKPPGINAGGAINNTTMRNTTWRTFSGKVLKTLTNIDVTAAYDPNCYSQLVSMAGKNQTVTVTHSNGNSWAIQAMMDSAEPNANTAEEEMPTMQIVFIPTNVNAAGAETGPSFGTAAPTTTTTTGTTAAP